MPLIDANYHTHTQRCKHATGDVAAYCAAAVSAGLAVLGMSDHNPYPDRRWEAVRMDLTELDDYCAEIDRARRRFPQLTILKGLEAEYVPEYENFLREEILGERGIEYLVLGVHSCPMGDRWLNVYGEVIDARTLGAFADTTVRAMQTGLYAFVAHPDLYGNCYLEWDDQAVACARAIIQAAANLNIPLEINGYGLRKPQVCTPQGPRLMYPWMPFWEMAAEYDVRIVVCSDAHRPQDVAASMDECLEIAQRFGLGLADLSPLHDRAQAATRSAGSCR